MQTTEKTALPLADLEWIIREAAKLMLEADSARMHVEEKSGTANFVTEYDVRVQRTLQAAFSELLPGCGYLAEEEGESENAIGAGYTFIIDPIDGTTNFMLGRRASCISVALLEDSKTVYGAIYDPYADRFYMATAGGGAFCNGQPIHVSDREPLKGVAAIGTAPYYKETLSRPVTEIIYAMLQNFGDIRRVGSAALDLCDVACGVSVAYCEPILSPWDFAAGRLLVEEAGGIVTDMHGDPLPQDKPAGVLAASPKAYETLKKTVDAAMAACK